METQQLKDPEEIGVTGSSSSHSPSWSQAKGPTRNYPNTSYSLGIHVTLTKETGAVSHPSYTWTGL